MLYFLQNSIRLIPLISDLLGQRIKNQIYKARKIHQMPLSMFLAFGRITSQSIAIEFPRGPEVRVPTL